MMICHRYPSTLHITKVLEIGIFLDKSKTKHLPNHKTIHALNNKIIANITTSSETMEITHKMEMVDPAAIMVKIPTGIIKTINTNKTITKVNKSLLKQLR
jgi:hypothetical protein